MRLSYSQAWQLKEKTKERIYGLPKNYYKLLPWICQRLLQTNPRTIMEVTHSYDDHFEKLFGKHMTVGKEVIIISGRHPALLRSVPEVFGVENHAYCYHHLKENFKV